MKQQQFCTFMGAYNTELSVSVSKRQGKNKNHITVKFSVEFNNPTSLDQKRIPQDHMPAFPVEIGSVTQARLTYYENDLGNWFYSVINLTGANASNFYRISGRRMTRETWEFDFQIPSNTEWDSFRGTFQLSPLYDNNNSQANCCYYNSSSITVFNDTDAAGGEACEDITTWMPGNDLPPQLYPYQTLNPGDMIGMRYGTEIKKVLVAPPVHPIPYQQGVDFDGCHRSNIVELNFNEPGIYAVRVNFEGGSDTRFYLVSSVFANNIQPFGIMNAFTTLDNSPDFAFEVSGNNALFNIATDFLNNLVSSSMNNIASILDNYKNTQPATVVICGDGDASTVFCSQSVNWELDALCNPSSSLKEFIIGAKGVVQYLYITNPNVGNGLDTVNCQLVKYIASSLVSSSPYSPYSPYHQPLDFATVFAFDGPVAVVDNGNRRAGYFCYSGNAVSFTATPGQSLAMLARSRVSKNKEPNFYLHSKR